MTTGDTNGKGFCRLLALTPLLGAVIAAAACVGQIGDGNGPLGGAGAGAAGGPGSGSGAAALCTSPQPGSAPVRRLTQSEYDNTVRDLLGDTTQPAKGFPPDQQLGDFTNTAVALTVPPLLAQAYQTAAEALATTAITRGASLFGCDPAKAGEDACAQSFVQSFGKRAFRRPLTQDEQNLYVALYQTNKTGADFNNGVQAVVEALLQSAVFLYRVEFGDAAQAQGSVLPVTSYEMASRLSYFLWGSMPDDALFAAAGANQLGTPAEVAAQARRMLADPKAKPAVDQFYAEWLMLDHVDATAKDPKTYPAYTATLQAAMQSETLAFVDWVMWQSDARLSTLLTSSVSFVNEELAAVYGVAGVTGTSLAKVNLDPSERAGVLTQLAMMSVLGKPDRSSPVLRGKFVREHLLCQPISPPPTNIKIPPVSVTPGLPTRDAFAEHDKVEPCKSCHTLMDPIGFGFESYDGMGKYRTVDQGQPVNASGTLSGSDVDGPFDGAVALAQKLSESRLVSDCVATEWFRYAFGRGETPTDACSLQNIKQAFATNQFDMRELLVAITQTDAFRYRPQVTP